MEQNLEKKLRKTPMFTEQVSQSHSELSKGTKIYDLHSHAKIEKNDEFH